MKPLIIFFNAFLLISCIDKKYHHAIHEISALSEEDELEIEKLASELPLILAKEGWDSYEDNFSKNYNNWPMDNEQVRSRSEFLKIIKKWYDDGNRPVESELKAIDFIPITNELTLFLSVQKEEFYDPTDDSYSSFNLGNVSIFKKENGRWKYQFTAFMDVPEN